jgi:hypothetical protein
MPAAGTGISLFWFSFLILILLLIRTEEGEEIKIKIRSKIKRGTQKCDSTRRTLALMKRRPETPKISPPLNSQSTLGWPSSTRISPFQGKTPVDY